MRARVLSCIAAALAASCAAPPSSPEARAVRYLAREVPRWPLKNNCFSCHNNGDAARALREARRRSLPFDGAALESTDRWLRRPEGWKNNGPEVEYSDKKLATLQFAHALADDGPGEALTRAAGMVRDLQEPDGSWAVDADGQPGSPVTYGRTLATVVARRILLAAGFADAAASAERWLQSRMPAGVLDAGALLLGGTARVDLCLAILRKGQTRDGGWGPYITSPPEVFDTAIVLLGLAGRPGAEEMIRRGREFLIQSQNSDGSWPETTRPPGADSYAQRISTTGWATLALLATGAARRED